uniref:FAD-binding domain-containing protein n=1 Tax=Bionectria ochroleuca TaxID=29856 RepID=A0A0B7KN38_BIOOC
MSPSEPVLIIGSGLSGLALGQSLKRLGIPFHIFERDAANDQRAQGYRIRINQIGLDALRTCVPEDIYKRFEETTGENCKPSGSRRDPTTWAALPGRMGPPPPAQTPGAEGKPQPKATGMGFSLPADRRVMRSVLLSGLEDSVTYGKAFADYTITDTGVIAHFADGTSSGEGSLLVAADGLHSKVARKLAGERLLPKPTGSWMIFGKTILTPQFVQSVKSDLTTNMSILVEKDDQGRSLNFFSEPMRFSHSGAPSDYLPVLDQQESAETAVLRLNTSAIDGVPAWPTSERVTLIGDAVHCMPPTGGSGANTALRDVATLSRKLEEHMMDGDGWSKAVIQAYEEEMRPYASEIVALSYDAAVNRFGASPIISE